MKKPRPITITQETREGTPNGARKRMNARPKAIANTTEIKYRSKVFV
jgi:hypothetical protein